MGTAFFITGGTGMVGRELVPLILQKTDAEMYLFTHDSGRNLVKAGALVEYFGFSDHVGLAKRIHIVQGDITKPQLALSQSIYRDLTQSITHIIHAAASTRFDLPIEEARLINVTGTEQVAELGLHCSNLRQFGFLSTAYVSGRRKGLVFENELEHTAGFVNTYEQSKYEAELLLRRYRDTIPTAVYRLSTVFGDSLTGHVSHFTAPHQAIRIMYLGLAAMLPGTEEYSVDLISSNYTASAISHLFLDCFQPGRTYHLVHGPDSLTLREVVHQSYQCLAAADPAWGMRNYPEPAIVSEETFDLFMHSAQLANNALLGGVMGALNHFAHQLLYPKEFDQKNLREGFPEYYAGLPDIRQYFSRVVRYCVTTKWGRHAE